jgi:hypothetical protein
VEPGRYSHRDTTFPRNDTEVKFGSENVTESAEYWVLGCTTVSEPGQGWRHAGRPGAARGEGEREGGEREGSEASHHAPDQPLELPCHLPACVQHLLVR